MEFATIFKNVLLHCRREVESVTLGSLTQSTLEKGNIYEALKVTMHPKFNNDSVPNFNDIAIVTLKTNVDFSSSVRHICLPKYEETFLGQTAVVAGKT